MLGFGSACSGLLQHLRKLRSPLLNRGFNAGLLRSPSGRGESGEPPGLARLEGASLARARLCRAKLSHANLGGADLRGANLIEADLQGAVLRTANLDGADLRAADLRAAYLVCATLKGADLQGADLSGANLRWTNLRAADLRGAHRIDPRWPGPSLRHVLRTRSLPSDVSGTRLSPEGSFALALIPQGVDLSRSMWSGTGCEATVTQFLGLLLAALSGELANGPPLEELLALGFNHWRCEGCSALTSVDSIPDEALKVTMMQALFERLAARSDPELAPVARPLLDVLTRNPRYQDTQPQLAERLVRLGWKSTVSHAPRFPTPPTLAAACA
jgi:hypothetical protein